MALLIRELIERDLKGSLEDAENVQWRCERLADQLYPASDDYALADVAERKLFVDCYAISQGETMIPSDIGVDQLEDWLAARAVGAVCMVQAAQSDPNIRQLDSELSLHGFRTPLEAGHRWGE